MEKVEVLVVGAGQAGLATSHWLSLEGVDHLLLERDRSGESWLDRWDSFCLVTPNWTLDLPGYPYSGDDPAGFIHRDEIAAYVSNYRDFVDAPVIEETEVTHLVPIDTGWRVDSDRGRWLARAVVVATGAFPFESIPKVSHSIGDEIVQVHSQKYRNPSAMADGAVLVVGSGQSGAQIVDDLLQAGRHVWYSIGHASHAPRRYRGRDAAEWLNVIGFMDMPVTDEMRRRASLLVSGRDGGKDLNLRSFGQSGVQLVGRLLSASGMHVDFGTGVAEILDEADQVMNGLRTQIDEYIATNNIDAPEAEQPINSWRPKDTPTQVNLSSEGISSIVWATGYHYDFSWIEADVFGPRGYPIQQRGVTELPGLYFIGLHGMHTAGSGLFSGVGADAHHIVEHLTSTL